MFYTSSSTAGIWTSIPNDDDATAAVSSVAFSGTSSSWSTSHVPTTAASSSWISAAATARSSSGGTGRVPTRSHSSWFTWPSRHDDVSTRRRRSWPISRSPPNFYQQEPTTHQDVAGGGGAVPGVAGAGAAAIPQAGPLVNENIDFNIKIPDCLFQLSATKLPLTATQAASCKIPFGAI